MIMLETMTPLTDFYALPAEMAIAPLQAIKNCSFHCYLFTNAAGISLMGPNIALNDL
jgi:hypothetical protein